VDHRRVEGDEESRLYVLDVATGTGNRWIKWPTSRFRARSVKLEDFERTLRTSLLDRYARAGYCYVVTGSTQYGRALTEPEEVVPVVRMLLLENTNVNGQVLVIDGAAFRPADWYAAIRRRIEQMLALPREARDDPRKTLDALRKELNTVGSQFPEIGERDWLRAATEFEVREPPDGSPPVC
jgi:hypothetical protein